MIVDHANPLIYSSDNYGENDKISKFFHFILLFWVLIVVPKTNFLYFHHNNIQLSFLTFTLFKFSNIHQARNFIFFNISQSFIRNYGTRDLIKIYIVTIIHFRNFRNYIPRIRFILSNK